jgi:hypothetical protein
MRTWRTLPLTAVVAAALLTTGCPRQRGSDEPMPTDGPGQVVIKVPGMT